MKHIGDEIDKILLQKQIKKKDFANSIGMSNDNLSKVLKKASLDAGLLEKIATTLNIPASYFSENTSACPGKSPILSAAATAAVKNSNSQPSITKQSITGDERLWAMIESQQRILESQQRIIEELTKKGAAEVAPNVVPKAARG